jgi:hypothetical protein
MRYQGINESIPFIIIFRGTVPADAFILVVKIPGSSFNVTEIHHIQRHKADFEKRLTIIVQPDVTHSVNHVKIIDRLALFILNIYIGGTPFINSMADAGTKQMVGPHVIGFFQASEFSDEFHSSRRVGIIALIIADVIPGMRKDTCPFSRVDVHAYRFAHSLLLVV